MAKLIVNPETSDEHLNVNNAICSVSAASKKEDPSLSNNMIIDNTEHRDVIKRAILHKLNEADKDRNFWFSERDPERERIRALTRAVENDFNLNQDDLLKNYLRELLLYTFSEFFRNRKKN